VSEKMLEIARNKKLYDQIENADIHDALEQHHALDLIIAGDVFGYVGDLAHTFSLAQKACNKAGLFIFTTEKTWKGDFSLQKNARFAHHSAYIEKLANAHAFEIVCCENAVLRMQKEQPVEGLVWVLQRV